MHFLCRRVFIIALCDIAVGCTRTQPATTTAVAVPAIVNRPSAAAQAVLDDPETLELFSLDPRELFSLPKDESAVEFHGWRVLGSTTLSDPDEIRTTIQAINQGVANSDGRRASCFQPRHGIRITSKSKTVEIVICYECINVDFYLDGERDSDVHTITRESAPLLNSLLLEANVPLKPAVTKTKQNE